MKHRLAVVVAVLALVVIALGAYLTSDIRPLPGTTGPLGSDPALQQVHTIGGYIVAVLAIVLGVWALKPAGGFLPILALILALSSIWPLLHAIMSPIFFAAIVVVAVTTSPRWLAGPQRAPVSWPPVRILALLTPLLVVMQIGLGAAFRHNAMGVVSHIMNAFIVIAIVLIAGVFVVKQHPEHPDLKPAALALLITAGIQVLLGFAVYLVLLMAESNNIGLIITGVLHVTNGALTLAASVIFAMQVNRSLIKSSGA